MNPVSRMTSRISTKRVPGYEFQRFEPNAQRTFRFAGRPSANRARDAPNQNNTSLRIIREESTLAEFSRPEIRKTIVAFTNRVLFVSNADSGRLEAISESVSRRQKHGSAE